MYVIAARDVEKGFGQEKAKEKIVSSALEGWKDRTVGCYTQPNASAEGEGSNTCWSSSDELLYLA